MGIAKGLCYCGCGGETTIAKRNDLRKGWVGGQPIRYIYGHHNRGRNGADHPSWKGGERLNGYGYVLIRKPGHHRANVGGYVFEHILVAEKVLRKPLPKGVVVHHVNEDRADNRKENLVICENTKYHELLHVRLRALKACGHANWRKCKYCKTYDDPKNLFIAKYGAVYHKKCNNEYNKRYRR